MKIFLNFVCEFLFKGIFILFTLLDIIGAIIFFYPKLSNDQFNPFGLLLICLSLFISSFLLYRRTMTNFGEFVNSNDFIIRPHPAISSYNIFDIKYSGNENVSDLLVKVSYVDANGIEKEYIIQDYYHPDDTKMILGNINIESLSKDELVSFRTLHKKSTLNGIINISISGTGAKSGNKFFLQIPDQKLRY